jgi:hypothetical protein
MHQKSIFAKVSGVILAAIFAIILTSLPGLAASEFEGIWKVKDTKGEPFEITLSADGSAKATLKGMTGTWKQESGAALITWDTGWTTKLTKEGDHYKKTTWDKGKPLDGPPTDSSDAQKGG